MTNETAKEIYSIILNALNDKGFSDVMTFMLDQKSEGDEYFIFDKEYELWDSDMVNTETFFKKFENSNIALERLIDAGIEYFSIASKIPENFNKSLKQIEERSSKFQILLSTLNQNEEDVGKILEDRSISSIIEFLTKIKENLNLNDDEFFKTLEL